MDHNAYDDGGTAEAGTVDATTPVRYRYREDGGHEEWLAAQDMDEAEEMAQDLLETGDWGEIEDGDPSYIVSAQCDAVDCDGNVVDSRRVRHVVDPAEPECASEEGHDWQAPYDVVGGSRENPGMWASMGGCGGVTSREVCMRCGCGLIADTGAQDADTGEQYTSVRYEPRKYWRESDGEE